METRRHFTQAARDAAAIARRERREARLAQRDEDRLAMFVVRADEPQNRFRWEIRRFGLLNPVQESAEVYDSLTQAKQLGEQALARLQS